MPTKAAPKKLPRKPSGRREIPIGFWPEDEAAIERILVYLRAGFPGLKLRIADAVRHAVQEYAKLLPAPDKP
jgi:hypothetical protein